MTAAGPTPPLLPADQSGPARTCSRWMGTKACGIDAVAHLIWTSDCENGFACEDHRTEALNRWCPWAVHELGPDCGMPGAFFDERENTCIVPDAWSPELVVREKAGIAG